MSHHIEGDLSLSFIIYYDLYHSCVFFKGMIMIKVNLKRNERKCNMLIRKVTKTVGCESTTPLRLRT